MSQLVLGTAQFGMKYGISNESGQITKHEISNILTMAQLHNVSMLDTAMMYGDAEERLGEQLISHELFNVITKIPASIPYHAMFNQVTASIKKVKCSAFYGVLCHDADDLLHENADNLYVEMLRLKKEGLTQKIGVSVYSPNQAYEIVERYPIDMIQLPLSVYDQRFIISGCLKFLKESNIEIHVRSVFLQGLLLMDLNAIPSYFSPILNHIHSYYSYVDDLGISKQEAALNFIKLCNDIDYVVVGIQNKDQLLQLVTIWNQKKMDALSYKRFACDQEDFILPSRWIL